ncbi:MAG: hypothetical protein ABL877_06480 [Thiobacillus sp.]
MSGSIGLRFLALPVMGTVALGVAAYPFARIELAIGLALYAALGLWRPVWMLFLMPLGLALVNLAPWSGSLHLEEYDLLLGVTLMVALARGQYGMVIHLTRTQWLAIGLLVLSVGISFVRGFSPMPEWNPVELSTYYSHWNALRLSKGLLWALLLLPALSALLNAYGDQVRDKWVWGLALAGASVGLVSMWERQVFHAIAEAGSRYAILGSLLDFATPYRITGLFSEMHTGGEAIDGFMALTWPFALLAVATARSRWGIVGASGALIAALYAIVTTFSRISYIALAVGLLVGGVMMLRAHAKHRLPGQAGLRYALPGLLVPLALGYAHVLGGVVSLVFALATWAGSLMLGYGAARKPIRFAMLVLLAGSTVGVLGMARGMLTSQWVDHTFIQAGSWALGFAVLAAVGGYRAGRRLAPVITPRGLAMLVLLLAGGAAVVVPALLGSRMEVRFSTNKTDVNTRGGHWQAVLDSMQPGWTTHAFGMGVGRFPEAYLFTHGHAHGDYRFRQAGKTVQLILGGGEDLTFGQRVSLPAWQRYTLTLKARTDDALVNLRVRVCRRHILVPFDWNPQCVTTWQKLQRTGAQWQPLVWTFDSGELGDGSAWARRPLMLEIMNNQFRGDKKSVGTLVEVDAVSLIDSQGKQYIANGEFTRGLERWFPYYDFEHLPWHVKNLWVNLYFDQGLLGVLSFSAFLWVGLAAAIRLARQNSRWGIAAASAMASYLTVGMVGGLIDVPRVILLFYLLTLTTLLLSNAGVASPVNTARRRKHRRRSAALPEDNVAAT